MLDTDLKIRINKLPEVFETFGTVIFNASAVLLVF